MSTFYGAVHWKAVFWFNLKYKAQSLARRSADAADKSVLSKGVPDATSRCVPEKVVQCFAERLADGNAQLDGGIVVALFNGVNGLAAYADLFGKLLLR